MPTTALRLAINVSSVAEANRLATELEQWLKVRVDGVELQRKKEDSETQDAGSVILAVLAAPAVIEFSKGPALELAKGVADWLRKRRVSISIGADGSIEAENVTADTAEHLILETLRRRAKGNSD